MSIKASVHKFKGMNRDSDVSIANPEYAFENMNIRIEAVDNNTQLSITNEKGNKELTIYDEDGENIISIDGVPIGYGIVDENLVLFTTDAEGSIPDNPTNPKNIFKFTSCIFGGIINNNIRLYVKISELGNPTRLDSITMKAKFSVISFDPITGNLTTTYLGEKSGNRSVNISGIYYDFSIGGTYRYIILHEITFLYMGKILYLSNSSMWLDTNYTNTIINDVVKTDYFPIYTSTTGIDVTSGWTGITKTNTGYFVFDINGNVTLSGNIYITDEDRYYEYNHFISDWLSTNLLSLPMERPEGDLVVGVVGFKNSDVTNPVTTMTIGDSDIYGVVGENAIVYVNIEPEGASNAYDFLQPTFDDEFLIFNGRNNFHFSTTLIKATSNAAGTPFQINHSAADSVTAYIHIEDFELSYELLHWEVGDALEITRLGFNSNGDNTTQADARVTCNSVFKITYSEGTSDWIRISPSASEYNTGDSILYPNNYINLKFTAEKNTLPTSRSGEIYFSPVSDLVTFEPLILEVHQDSSPTVQLTFELGYTIPIDDYGISINATFSNNSTSTIRLERVKLYYVRGGLINTYQTFYDGSVYEDIAGGESLELNTELLASDLNTREATNPPFPVYNGFINYVAIEYQVGNTTYGGWNTLGYMKNIALESKE